eukprot:CAMPEP_0185789748 /NCGR_PEP_ID=MMETSP1174-20130828/152674_1 /TAXON_ID=35687 /ORGANISM="Dictyocha speculum, Strain CCMP1381" /LENGTH=51 /DNA_ID=CAMNT_0028484031 /DNA_START=54 /DNA_END=206 /DNA_ORIENTATION=-
MTRNEPAWNQSIVQSLLQEAKSRFDGKKKTGAGLMFQQACEPLPDTTVKRL